MQLSIIIVNYNVKHFLEQCLFSVAKAIQPIQAEVIIVDNNSTDGSIAYLKPLFPHFLFVENKINTGFGKACNQGLQLAKGEHILFLNPDVLVPEDCFTACLTFFSQQPSAGAIGIKMIDGNGSFLKESKRAFPSPFTSLYKLLGLSFLFPKSKVFAKYYLGHLPNHQLHEIDVISGAFMMVRTHLLKSTGGFDEQFFMYGEDVDLSYRLQKSGYKNFYFPHTSIVHFKGESTKKGDINYTKMFYNAMRLFVKKHYQGGIAGLYNMFIQFAIALLGTLSFITRFIKKIGLPLLDAIFILLSFGFTQWLWAGYIRPHILYNYTLLLIAIPAFTLLYWLTAYFAGLYDKEYKPAKLLKATLTATLVLLASYALLPEHLRFSRAIIFFGAVLAYVLMWVLRKILVHFFIIKQYINSKKYQHICIVSSANEYDTAMQILQVNQLGETAIGRLGIDATDTNSLGYWKNIQSLKKGTTIHEIVFCLGTLTYKEVIDFLPQIKRKFQVKFYATQSKSIVGSYFKNQKGEWYIEQPQLAIANAQNKRYKRLIDILVALSGGIFFPVHLFFIKKPFNFLSNCWAVLIGKKTWVGYAHNNANLPYIKPGIINCNGLPKNTNIESNALISFWYARDYKPTYDLKIIIAAYKNLGDNDK